jgi:uncharacterized protein (TIGR02421 family)
MINDVDLKKIISVSDDLLAITEDVKILRNIAWEDTIQQDFFRHKAQRLPLVTYAPYDPNPVLENIARVRKDIVEAPYIKKFATRIANKLETSALLLSSRGKKSFFDYSKQLYGEPTNELENGSSTILDLALHFDSLYHRVKFEDFAPEETPVVTAEMLAGRMREACNTMFGEYAPEVVMDANLASNALAGRRRISIRPDALFNDKDVDQLIEHEAYVHVATSINGFLQPYLKILIEGHAGTTSTQEGLAVFAEFITGHTDLDRLRRLSDRVIAIQKAIDGGDFIDIYRYFLEITDNPEQSFQNAKRVFRGGVITGGAPFTKDVVYLEGLADIHNFLRLAVAKGKFDYLDLLFVGKLDLADLPTIKKLSELGLVSPPKFTPPWIKDKRYLLSYLSYSSFLTTFDSSVSSPFYEKIFDRYDL